MSETIYDRGTVLGSSVRGFSSTIGWNDGGSSTTTIQLVDDSANGDSFDPVPAGYPLHFGFYGFEFPGILQKYEQRNAVDGYPTFEVTLTDPRDLLSSCEIITGSYSGSANSVVNLFNVYGWWESQGFGQADVNDAGMPWQKIVSALSVLVNTPINLNPYGGHIYFRDHAYGLDLSQLPITPYQYRIGGTSVNLMDAISQVCADGGVDYFVELVGSIIRVRTVSRFSQPPLGTISTLINNASGSVNRSNVGVELRNEVTSSFVVGGQKTDIYETSNISTFWGFDFNGNPILGYPTSVGSLPTIGMNLNSAPVADITGSVTYQCTELELRHALAGYEQWATFMADAKPNFAGAMGLYATYGNFGDSLFKTDTVNDETQAILNLAASAIEGAAIVRMQRLYEFVLGIAREHMGRTYVVSLPFLLANQDSETLTIKTSWEVTDAGYRAEGTFPLGLLPINEDFFTNDDGRFRAFGVYTDTNNVDLTAIHPGGTVSQGSYLYFQCGVDRNIVFTPNPGVIVSLPGVLARQSSDTVGDLSLINAVYNQDEAGGQERLKELLNSGAIAVGIAPPVVHPAAIAIPLQSNIYTYGPWYATGAPGKVRFESDSSLTPWNYGGYEAMNIAGVSKVNQSVTNMQVAESGSIDIAGPPVASLGDILEAGGPNITNIDVTVDSNQGVTTNYRFSTFTPRFGVFSKGQAERLRRFSLVQQDFRRHLRAKIRENFVRNEILIGASQAVGFSRGRPKALKKESPHDVIISYAKEADDGSIRQITQTATYEEALVFIGADNDEKYQNCGAVSLNGLFRPFTTKVGEHATLPAYIDPEIEDKDSEGNYLMTVKSLDPWGGGDNDIDIFITGDSYSPLNTSRNTEAKSSDNIRPLSLRGPLVVSGYGLGIDTKPVPGEGDEFIEGFRHKQNEWKTGPVDMLWDDKRGVWTSHDLVMGTLVSDQIEGDGSGLMSVKCGDGTEFDLLIHNGYGCSISGEGLKMQAGYFAHQNKWLIISAECEDCGDE